MKHHINLAVIATLFMMQMVLGTPIENKKFGKKLGIHFEEFGTVTLSNTEWNLFVYYDLNPYWTETSTLVNSTQSLKNLCQMINPNTSCIRIVDYFTRMESELQLDNQLLRSKRGALDIVGNVAHSLFGVLDAEYAKEMSETIQKVKENESYLLTLLKNQTSIVDSTINIIKQNQMTTNARFEKIEKELETYAAEEDYVKDILTQLHLSELFQSAAFELNIIATNLLRIQTSITDALIDTQHGKISPMLLSPQQLKTELSRIQGHLPPFLKFPISEENQLLKLFKLMTVKGRLTQQHAVFKVTLPLVDDEEFKLFHLTPVPNIINNTVFAIKSCADFLGINAHRKQFIHLTNSELKACDTTTSNVFLCTHVQIRYNYGSEICACDINLFNNKTTPTCIIEGTSAKWIPLLKGNQWIYSTVLPSQATVACNREIIHVTIKGTGILTLDPDCILKHELAMMNARQTISSTVKSSYTSLGSFSKMSVGIQHTARMMNNQSNSTELEARYSKGLRELEALHKTLQENKILELPNEINSHQRHSYSIMYLALFLSIATLIGVTVNYMKGSRGRQPPLTSSTESTNELNKAQTTSTEPTNDDIELQSEPAPLPKLRILPIPTLHY